jgi:protein TonB
VPSTAYLASTRIRATLGRRGMAMVLALLVEALIALLLLFMAPDLPGVEDGARTTTFDVSTGDSEEAAEQSPAKSAPAKASRSQPQPSPCGRPKYSPSSRRRRKSRSYCPTASSR